MNTDYLSLSEEAASRARLEAEKGNTRSACEAYLKAAEYMLRFSDTQQGQRRSDARSLSEQLMRKAQQLRTQTAEQEAARQQSPAPQPAAAPAKKPSDPGSNRSAIAQDMESYRRTASKKPGSGDGTELKFLPVEPPNVHFSDIAGLENVKSIIQMKVIQPILHPELYERFSKARNGGILLYGPPGTGKTMIARAIATETKVDFFSVRCSDIVGKSFGDGERNLRALFDAARESGHAMIFFDEFESLACKRGGGSTIMNRIVPELLSQMDGFVQAEGLLIVLASTNRPWDLDSAVLRPPRMTERIYVGLPDFPARHFMVRKGLEPLPKKEALDYDRIADALEGYNCADITAFVEKVKEAPIRRGLDQGSTEQYVTREDVEEALAHSHSSVQKSDLEAFSKWEASQR